MSEEIIPDVVLTSDVPETVENIVEEAAENHVSYSEKTLAEIVRLFEELMNDEGRMKRAKDAEALKAAFYKRLQKEKFDAGLTATDVVPAEQTADEQEVVEETEDTVSENPFAEIEKGFKDLYNRYRKEKADYNRQLDKEREDNLAAKEQVIADLKNLIEKQEDVNATFPEFREIQNRWRAAGPVPAQNFRNINETYQLYVEQFYDMVKINRELRDLDFKKNLEAKEEFCALAEKLAEDENVIEAFRELQKLHEQWKEFGPVAKEFREQIWERFKAATAAVNKRYQAHFEGLKEQHADNLAKKTVLCEKVEEIAEREVTDSNQWNAFSKEIEDIQKEWRTIGFASKKDNQKIYDRFRAACDKFYERKREFYNEYKDSINANLDKKIALCEQAEALMTSTEWKKATDQFINLQKQWKEIGAVPRKKSEQLWKRFRAACDEFFAERDKNAKPENDFYGNLKAKQALIEEIQANREAYADKLEKAQLYPVFRQPEKRVEMLADGRLVWRVMSNLLSNAVKYATEGGNIRIWVYKSYEGARLDIENTSPPLPTDAMEKIFDSFYRVDASRTEPGTGLGLAIVKTVAELHRGKCAVRNKRYKDETCVEFSVTLPLS